MPALVSRCLVFCAAVGLALPPGWCCILPQAMSSATEQVPTEQVPPSKLCCCCTPESEPPARTPEEPRAPDEPAQVPSPGCCCPHAEATKVASADKPADYGSALAVLFPSRPFTAAGSLRIIASSHGPAEPIPLQILHCVWRC